MKFYLMITQTLQSGNSETIRSPTIEAESFNKAMKLARKQIKNLRIDQGITSIELATGPRGVLLGQAEFEKIIARVSNKEKK